MQPTNPNYTLLLVCTIFKCFTGSKVAVVPHHHVDESLIEVPQAPNKRIFRCGLEELSLRVAIELMEFQNGKGVARLNKDLDGRQFLFRF